MAKAKEEETVFVIDLSKSTCYVCGRPLQRHFKTAKERCVNPECQIRGVMFNTPFVPEDSKLQSTAEYYAQDHERNELTGR